MRRISAVDADAPPLWRAAAPAGPQCGGEDLVRRQAEDLLAAQERGYREGYRRGEQEAKEQVRRSAEADRQREDRDALELRRQLEADRKRFEALCLELPVAFEREVAKLDEVVVDVAFAAVARFLGERYAQGELMKELVDHALMHVGGRVEAVRVCEQDLPLLCGIASTRIVADARLQPGQCAVETGLGRYEAGLDVRLDLMKEALLAGLAQHRGGERTP